jgi:peptidoglycan-associated lipoprotein
MMHRKQGSVYFVILAGLVGVLAMGGCAKKNVMATTSGTETTQGEAGMQGEGGPGATSGPGFPGGPGGPGALGKVPPGGEGGGRLPGGSEPLKGFAKTPQEEPVKESLKPAQPMVVAKADQQEIEARRAQEEAKAREAAKRELRDIYFAFDKWALSSEGKKNLVESKEYLLQNANAKLLIEGHCDERGSREYNLVLGERRAKEVRRYLMDLGIKNKVAINSFGKERPVCQEQDESCYSRNRRAHLVVEGGQ